MAEFSYSSLVLLVEEMLELMLELISMLMVVLGMQIFYTATASCSILCKAELA